MKTLASDAVKTTAIDIYDMAPIPWSRAKTQLEAATAATEGEELAPASYWLATVSPDGAPHVAAVGALWLDGRFYFTSGDGTRKSRNIAVDSRCVLSASLRDLDLVVEGRASKVTDMPTLERVAAIYDAHGWPARASNGAITAEYSAPSAGPAPWNLYAVVPEVAFGVATAEPQGATRWRFDVPG